MIQFLKRAWNHPSGKPLMAGIIIGFLLYKAFELAAGRPPQNTTATVPAGDLTPITRPVPGPSGDPAKSAPMVVSNQLGGPTGSAKGASLQVDWIANYVSALNRSTAEIIGAPAAQKDTMRKKLQELISRAHQRGDAQLKAHPEVAAEEAAAKLKAGLP